MTQSVTDSDRILVRLAGISQELSVGVGAAIATVRTLTDISLTIRKGELVMLSGGRGGGERAMLAVIAGDQRGVSGEREIHPNVRLRALRISASSAIALAEEWERACTARLPGAGATAVQQEVADRLSKAHTVHDVFLLDVVSDAVAATSQSPSAARRRWRSPRGSHTMPDGPKPWNEANRPALALWARQCQDRDGAIVMASDEDVGLALMRRGAGPMAVREAPVRHSLIRVIAMHCGRLAASVRVAVTGRVMVS